MTQEPIYCFNGGECIYIECNGRQFNEQLDTCNFLITGLLRPKTPPTQPTESRSSSPTQTPLEANYRFINTLKVGDKEVSVKGKLLYDPIQKEVNTKRGPKTVTNIVIDDGTGKLGIAFWEEQADKVMEFVKGDILLIEKIWEIKEPYDNVLKASAGRGFKVTPQ